MASPIHPSVSDTMARHVSVSAGLLLEQDLSPCYRAKTTSKDFVDLDNTKLDWRAIVKRKMMRDTSSLYCSFLLFYPLIH